MKINIKKLISLSLVSAMVASVASMSTFATVAVDGSLDDIKLFALKDGNQIEGDGQSPRSITTPDGRECYVFRINVNYGETCRFVFGLNSTCPFGKHDDTIGSSDQLVYPASDASNAIKIGDNILSKLSGVDIKVGALSVIADSTSYQDAYGVTVVGKNQSTSTIQSAYPIMLRDSNQKTKVFLLIITSQNITSQDVLDSRFNADGDNVIKLSVPFFSNESRKINVNVDNNYIMKVLGTESCKKIMDGNYKKLQVYNLSAGLQQITIRTVAGDLILDFDINAKSEAVRNFIAHILMLIRDKKYNGSLLLSIFNKNISGPNVRHYNYGDLVISPNSKNSNYYIVSNKNGCEFYGDDFIVFGHVIDGFDVLDTIQSQATDLNDEPDCFLIENK